AKTVAELIALAKAKPGTISMASFGTGSASHLAGELFKMMAGVNLLHVPYRGGAPMATDLVGGQGQVAFDVMVTSLPHIRSGGLRALAVAGSQRFDMLPDVPTIAETLPGYEARTWIGVCAPAGTPVEIIKRLNREINAGLATADIRARLSDVGTIHEPRRRDGPCRGCAASAYKGVSYPQPPDKTPAKQVVRPASVEMHPRPSRSFIFAPLLSRRSRGGQLNQISIA